MPRWQGFRLVAADASPLMPAIRQCHRARSLAGTDQRLFALYRERLGVPPCLTVIVA